METESESKGEEEDSAEEESLRGKAEGEVGQRAVDVWESFLGHTVWSSAPGNILW